MINMFLGCHQMTNLLEADDGIPASLKNCVQEPKSGRKAMDILISAHQRHKKILIIFMSVTSRMSGEHR